VEIRFCDLCNESVPLSDLRSGRARQVAERVICAACEVAMGGHGGAGDVERGALALAFQPQAARETPGFASTVVEGGLAPVALAGSGEGHSTARRSDQRRDGGGAGAEWAAGFAILVAGGLGFLGIHRLEKSEKQLGAALAEQAGMLTEFTGRLAAADSQLADALSQDQQGQAAQGEELRSMELRWRADLAGVAGQLTGLAGELTGLRAALHEAQPGEARLLALERSVGATQRDLQELTGAVLALSERLALAPASSTVQGAGPSAAAGQEQAVPAYERELIHLTSPSPEKRWAAVDALSRLKEPAAAPHLLPALKDSDIFVRLAAARVLGELGNLVAVPALIEALEDPEPSVAEASVAALRTLTGRNFKFDPSESQTERKKRAQAWREWWERSGATGEAPKSLTQQR
jgi:hypothetical protein